MPLQVDIVFDTISCKCKMCGKLVKRVLESEHYPQEAEDRFIEGLEDEDWKHRPGYGNLCPRCYAGSEPAKPMPPKTYKDTEQRKL